MLEKHLISHELFPSCFEWPTIFSWGDKKDNNIHRQTAEIKNITWKVLRSDNNFAKIDIVMVDESHSKSLVTNVNRQTIIVASILS